jgi:hypothetical protein
LPGFLEYVGLLVALLYLCVNLLDLSKILAKEFLLKCLLQPKPDLKNLNENVDLWAG